MTNLVKILLLLMACSAQAAINAPPIMTENFPPLSYPDGDKLKGASVEVVEQIKKKLKTDREIRMMPWSRAYNLLLKEDDHILFSMARVPAREPLFKWVGPLITYNTVFFKKKSNASVTPINTLEQAKRYKVAVTKNTSGHIFLKEKGFKQLDVQVTSRTNPRKLMVERVDLWMAGEITGLYKAKQQGVDTTQLEVAYVIGTESLYIAFSKTTDDAIIQKWQSALDELKAEGTWDQIMAQYKAH